MLLNHSDCDGEITPLEAARLLPALKEYRARKRPKKTDALDAGYWELLDDWIKVCESSIRLERDILFG